MNQGAIIFLAGILATPALADCGALGRQGKELDPRVDAAMEEYKSIAAAAAKSADRSGVFSKAISANRKLLSVMNSYIELLERGQAEGCFGTQQETWKRMLEVLKTRRDQFNRELDTLLKAMPDVAKDKNNKTTAGTTTIEFLNEKLDATFKSVNEQAPIEIDSKTLLRTVQRTGKVITYHYEVKINKSGWTNSMHQLLVQGTTKNVCDNENTRSLLGMGYEYRYVSIDPAGLLLANILVTAKKCEEFSTQQILR